MKSKLISGSQARHNGEHNFEADSSSGYPVHAIGGMGQPLGGTSDS